ncbi:Na/Pi cotransporter family protein [Caldanaerobius polysaccharolyticus]|uniref:Na/Pi cotransporter family protein n=1 Tax=Caldanaerobius polysaccharolyticus TaxID=44256 RepID=UPI00047ECC85|nr:Na/Pi symporter [Caldanaerobius polysaccharolyticus]
MQYTVVAIKIFLGLCVFLFGVYFMNDALKGMATEKVKRLMARVSRSVLVNIFIGFAITALSGSSSGVIIMLISFIDAGVIDFGQAAAIIMGSNIGSTITVNIISFNAFYYTVYLVPIGVLGYILSRNSKLRCISQFVAGIGLLFYGIDYMSDSMMPLRENLNFVGMMQGIDDSPFKGLLIGIALVTIIQSSTVGIAMLQSLARADMISAFGAAPIVFGQNISTCFDTLIAAVITKNKSAKNAAYFHLLFNVFGTVIFMMLLNPLVDLSKAIGGNDPARQIAVIHTLFNVGTTLIILPFIKYIV